MKAQRRVARRVAILGMALFICVPSAQGQRCPELVDSLHPYYWGLGEPLLVESSGDFAYVIGYQHLFKGLGSVIAVLDVSDPEGPRIVNQIGTMGFLKKSDFFISDLSLSEDRLFMTNASPSRLDFVGLSDPLNPTVIKDYFPIEDDPGVWDESEVFVSGDFVYLATFGGLTILEVSDIENPTEVGSLEFSWSPSDLVVVAGRAYVTEPEAGLRIIDVSDPAFPFVLGWWQSPWEARDLDVSEGLAYVADGIGGLRIIDVTDPENPGEIGFFETPGEAWKVSVKGPLAAVAMGYEGVAVIDVSDPVSPVELDIYATTSALWDVALNGTSAYVAASDGSLVHHLNRGQPQPPTGEPGWSGFLAIDVSIPERSVEHAFSKFEPAPMDVAISGDVKYVAAGDGGLVVWGPRNLLGWVDTPGFATGVTLHGELVLVADDKKGLRIIDGSDLSRLVEVGFIDTPGQARRVAAAGNFAYVADGDEGLRIIDISSAAHPVEVGFYDTPGQVADVAVAEDLVYVADGPGGLRVIDVSDPTRPFENVTKSYPKYSGVRSLAIKDQMLFVAEEDRLLVMDISSPDSPRPLDGFCPAEGIPTEVIVEGNYAHVATRSMDRWSVGGVDVCHISFPERSLERVGRWDFAGNATGLAAIDGHIYVAAGEDGVQILNTRCLTTYWVELVTHQSGHNGSEWRSDVIIVPRRQWPLDSFGARIEFILHTKDGVFTGDAAITPWSTGVFEDIVGILGYEGKGALEIMSDVPLWVSSRVYNLTESGGTLGAYLPGYRSSDCLTDGQSAFLHGLRQEGGKFRTNISVTNISPEAKTVRIGLRRADGTNLGSYSLWVESGMTLQDLQPFKHRANQPNIGWGYAEVAIGYKERGIFASATVIDSRTNDAVVVPMVREAGVGTKRDLPD